MSSNITMLERDCELPASSREGKKVGKKKTEVTGLLTFHCEVLYVLHRLRTLLYPRVSTSFYSRYVTTVTWCAANLHDLHRQGRTVVSGVRSKKGGYQDITRFKKYAPLHPY